jgi:copper transport protein
VVVQHDAAPAVRRRLWSIVVVCAIALAVVAALGLPFEAAEQDGTGLLKGLDARAIASVRGTRFGEIWLARAWLALIIAALAFSLERWSPARRVREGLLLGAAVALALTPTASGHANVDGTLAFLVDALHVLSAAAWGGGLAFLAAGLAFTPRAERWPSAARIVPRFSALALGSVAVLLAAGGANAYLEVRAFRGFVDSTYGALVLVKIALAIPLLALGAFNNRVSVPRLRAGLGSAAVHHRFARAVGAELLVFALIVGVTAVLIDEAPAKNVAPSPAGPVSTQTTVGPFTATLRVAPARAGVNTIDVRVTNGRGRPANIAEVTVAASLPSRSLCPLNYTARRLGGGRFRVTGARLAIAGTWRLQLGVRQGQFNEWLQNVPVTIGS